MQIDRTPPELRPAPSFGADTDEVLHGIGMDIDAVIEAKIDAGQFENWLLDLRGDGEEEVALEEKDA